MENRTENINIMTNKINVLESRIQHLDSLTNKILTETKLELKKQIEELVLKKEEARKVLDKIKNV